MRRDCKESLLQRQPLTFDIFVTLPSPPPRAVANITITRRHNVLALFQAHAEQALARGEAPKGLEQAFAASIHVSASMWSQVKASRPIGDKLARQIEVHAGKPGGWLDEAHASTAPSKTEAAFLALALAAYRASSREERRVLTAALLDAQAQKS